MQRSLSSSCVAGPTTKFLTALALGCIATAQRSPVAGPGTQAPRDDVAASLVQLEGFVLEPDGSPAQGAVVVSSDGGRAVTDENGAYRLETRAPLGTELVQVTAAGRTGSGFLASARVTLAGTPNITRVPPLVLARGETCQPSWLPTFGGPSPAVRALAVFDDGGGPELYAGGEFTLAGGERVNRIARWDGTSWTTVGGGLNGDVQALAVFDDGDGPALYAGGAFNRSGNLTVLRIARWDGASWTAVGGGIGNSAYDVVHALAVFDDGGGPALYAGGDFTSAGGGSASRIAKWDGASWSALGSGVSSTVHALTEFDDGGGPALYAGGAFTSAGGVPASRIAKWDGASWSALGSGVTGVVHALTEFDDGGVPKLCAAGEFTNAGGGSANHVARWNGASWSNMGFAGIVSTVHALITFDDGGGPKLYAGGAGVWRWTGSSWSSLGSAIDGVEAFAPFDDGGGTALHAGGRFSTIGGVAANNVAKRDGVDWSALGAGTGGRGVGTVRALTVHDDGDGPALHAAMSNFVERWDGASWSALGGFMSHLITSLTVFDDGGGPELYVGGLFSIPGGGPADRIARWDGASWVSVGGGTNGSINAITVFDDGGGPALYAGGSFTTAGGVAANRIAKWNGASWSALCSGIDGLVSALCAFDDGSGPALYAGGSFATAGGVAASRIAKWDGASWSALGSGISGGFAEVRALATFDDGSGPALFAGGFFTTAGGAAASNLARWDGSTWSPVSGGVSDGIYTFAVHDAGDGPALYVGGDFFDAGGLLAPRVARWDGSSWSALGSSMDAGVRAMASFDDGAGPALYAGGSFTAFDSGDVCLAFWGCDTTPPVPACAPVIAFGPPGSPGDVVQFAVPATDDHDLAPTTECVPPPGSFFPLGSTLVTCTATDFSGNESSCQFTLTVRPKTVRKKL